MSRKKSTFRTVTALKSGKFSGRYLDPNGNRRSLGRTFRTKSEARAALAAMQTDLARGQWIDPDDGDIAFADFAELVRQSRVGDLAARTQQEKVYLLNSMLPTFGSKTLNKISAKDVTLWWAKNADRPVARRNRYGLLSNIMRTAVDWEFINKSPCRIKDAFADVAAERPVHTVAEFESVIAHLEPDLRAVMRVLFAAHLRIGEVCGLNWSDWDAKTGLLTVQRQTDRTQPGGATTATKTGSIKSIRPLQMGVEALLEQQKHRSGIGAVPVFCGPSGGRLRPVYLSQRWRVACVAAGVADFHVHDVRHVSLTVIGQTTKSLATVMARGGHTTSRAALRYQSATRSADEAAALAADEVLRRQMRG